MTTEPAHKDLDIAVIEAWSGNPAGTQREQFHVVYRTVRGRDKVRIRISAGQNRDLADELAEAINLSNWLDIEDGWDDGVYD